MLRRANCPSWPGGVAAAKRMIAKHPLCRRRGGGSIDFCRAWTTTPSAPSPSAIGASTPPGQEGQFARSSDHSHLHRPRLQRQGSTSHSRARFYWLLCRHKTMGRSHQVAKGTVVEPIQSYEDGRIVHVVIGQVVRVRGFLHEGVALIEVDTESQRAGFDVFLNRHPGEQLSVRLQARPSKRGSRFDTRQLQPDLPDRLKRQCVGLALWSRFFCFGHLATDFRGARLH
jgi:hypothetical protein